jgi:hypothetical protein
MISQNQEDSESDDMSQGIEETVIGQINGLPTAVFKLLARNGG